MINYEKALCEQQQQQLWWKTEECGSGLDVLGSKVREGRRGEGRRERGRERRGSFGIDLAGP